MTEAPHFEPLRPAHAIERCAVLVMFDQPLPTRPYEKAAAILSEQMEALRFSPVGQTFDITIHGGRIAVEERATLKTYNSADRASQLTMAPTMIAWQTNRYVRWTPFRGEFERVTRSVIKQFLDVVSVSAVKLEYVDRFIWTGPLDTIEPWQLLRQDTELLSVKAVKPGTAWHSHCGWFDMRDGDRRLVNVNVDVVEIAAPLKEAKPSIGIYTMMQDNIGIGTISSPENVSERLQELHSDLKKLLSLIIVPSMAKRISLNAEGEL